ncbi:hypothetical protein PI125_g21326 [Phytophthora idaei]|nr:hypothetical protein PI125_g21326 [Phytophthora idaei]KAG3132251.1 hypothetical protein PI126_g19718 [Phytophthora idaei]
MRIDMDAGLWSTSGRASTCTAQNHLSRRHVIRLAPAISFAMLDAIVVCCRGFPCRLEEGEATGSGLRCRSDFAVALSSVIVPAEFENCSRY